VSLLTRSRDDPDGWLFTWERPGRRGANDDAGDENGAGDAENGDAGENGEKKGEPGTAGGGTNGSGGEGGAGGDEPAVRKGRFWRRRWRVIVVVVFLVTATLTLSPVSPFEQAQEHGRVPVPPGGVEPTPRPTQLPPPKPTPSLPPFPTAPPTSAPAPPPGPDPSPAPPTAAAPAAIQGEGYDLAYSDDFGDVGINSSVWTTADIGNPLPVTTEDGAMTLRTTEANDYHWGQVASTGPRSEGEPSYPNAQAWEHGYFEARIRYTDDPWAWPAFWLFSMAKTEAWPGEDCSELTSEWDIMENGVQNGEGDRPAGDWYFTALHRNTSDNTGDGYCGQPDEQRTYSQQITHTNLADWHTWGAYWSSDRFCTYMDDVELQCMEPYDTTSQPMHLTFTMQYLSRCDGCPPRPPELEMQVDWVRVWQG
jgi:hypothetical protein